MKIIYSIFHVMDEPVVSNERCHLGFSELMHASPARHPDELLSLLSSESQDLFGHPSLRR